MYVIDRLSRLRPLVQDQAVAIAIDFAFVGDPVRHLEEMGEHRGMTGLQVVYGRDVLFRNDQYMRWSNRADILEGDDLLVAIDLLRRDFPCEDLAEQAVLSHRQSSLRAE